VIGESISHYKIIEKIGEGGMGIVYKAEDTKLKRTVALKFLPPGYSSEPEAKNRFIHEARAASALDHPNICNIYEINETEEKQNYIAMAFYDGDSLKSKLASGILSIEESIEIAIELAKGLSRAHEEGIIHRDIKPANVIITSHNEVKILDFGLAKFSGQSKLTKTGTTVGTVAYMSPEQLSGNQVDNKTDIWALGVALYEMLSGKLPFEGDYEQAIMYAIMNENPASLKEFVSDIPEELEQVVNTALQKDPDDRYQNMSEMLTDLKRIQTGESITISPSWKLIFGITKRKRRRLLVSAIVTLLISIVLYTFVSQYFFKQESRDIYIALLPLKSISDEENQDWFSDGITEALNTDLSKISGLQVIGNRSVMQFAGTDELISDIARDLDASHIIEGSVTKIEDDIRISIRLIEPEKNETIWAENYNREYRNLLILQSEIAQNIASQVKISLTQEEELMFASLSEVNPKAHEYYLKAKYNIVKRTPQGNEEAKRYLDAALKEDSTWAPAYAALAQYYLSLAFYVSIPPGELMAQAKSAVQKALELDPLDFEPHWTQAYIAWSYDWDWTSAESGFKRAISLNPNNSTATLVYSWFLAHQGRHEEAIKLARKAYRLDPLFNGAGRNLGAVLNCAGRYADAVEHLQEMIILHPNDVQTLLRIGNSYLGSEMYDEAIEKMEKIVKLTGGSFAPFKAYLAKTYAAAGKEEQARKILRELLEIEKNSYVAPTNIASIYMELGEKEIAIDWLEKGYELRDPQMPHLRYHAYFNYESMCSEPRYMELLKKMKLDN